jgi:hypothetical protein
VQRNFPIFKLIGDPPGPNASRQVWRTEGTFSINSWIGAAILFPFVNRICNFSQQKQIAFLNYCDILFINWPAARAFP